MPRMRSLASKKPSREARTAIRRVLPATPLVPIPLPSIAAIRPPTKVPCPIASGTLGLPRGRVEGAGDACRATEVGVVDVDARVDHRDRARGPAARGGDRLTRADVVVEPGVLDLRGGIDAVEGIGGHPQLAVTLDVGHSPVGPQRAAAAAKPDGTRAASTPISGNSSTSAPRALSLPATAGRSECARTPTSRRAGPSPKRSDWDEDAAAARGAAPGSGRGSGMGAAVEARGWLRSASRRAARSITSAPAAGADEQRRRTEEGRWHRSPHRA